MAINGVVNTGTGPVYVNQNGLKNANVKAVFVSQTVLGGRGAATLAALTGTGTGVLPIVGTASKTLGDAGDATLGDLTGSATGVGGAITLGQGAATLENLTSSAAATLTAGAVDTLAQLVERAKGSGGVSPRRRRRKRDPIAIAARLWIRSPRLRAVVELGEPPIEPLAPEGELRGLLPLPTVRAIGAIGTRGRALLALSPPSIEARVFVVPCGDARLVLHPVVRARVRGRHDHFTDKQIERAVS